MCETGAQAPARCCRAVSQCCLQRLSEVFPRKGVFDFTFTSGGETNCPSEKILEQKKQQVAQLAEDFKKANVGVLVNYEGITVEKDTKLRKQLREAGCEYKVVKNTLLSLAFQEAGIEGLEEHLHGATPSLTARTAMWTPPRSCPTTPRITRTSR